MLLHSKNTHTHTQMQRFTHTDTYSSPQNTLPLTYGKFPTYRFSKIAFIPRGFEWTQTGRASCHSLLLLHLLAWVCVCMCVCIYRYDTAATCNTRRTHRMRNCEVYLAVDCTIKSEEMTLHWFWFQIRHKRLILHPRMHLMELLRYIMRFKL